MADSDKTGTGFNNDLYETVALATVIINFFWAPGTLPSAALPSSAAE